METGSVEEDSDFGIPGPAPEHADGGDVESSRRGGATAESERVALFGTTGSGKTLYLRNRYYNTRPCLWIDTAGDHEIDGSFTTHSVSEACDYMHENPDFLCVYRPSDLPLCSYPG